MKRMWLACAAMAAALVADAAGPSVSVTTSIVVRSGSRTAVVGTNEPNQYVIKLTAEMVVQTNGVREYVYRDMVFRIDEKGVTNMVAMQEEPNRLPLLVVNGLDLPDISAVFSALTNALPPHPPVPLQPPPPPPPSTYEYDDSLAFDHVGVPDGTGPVLSDYLGINDPLERYWNRPMFWVDGVLYVGVLRPLGKGYAFVVPAYVRRGIKRMDYNMEFPKRSLSCLLQAKFGGAGIEFSRFLVNTTVGVAGFYDPATDWLGMPTYDEDFGQAFASWGIGPGCYLYIPLVLPGGTIRDGVGAIFDSCSDPRGAVGFLVPGAGAAAVIVFKFNNMSLDLDMYDRIKDENLDSYVFVKDMWYLVRTTKIDN